MSGGVDSSVAALLLKRAGHEVLGVHLRLHDATLGASGGCCGIREAAQAAEVADRLGIPFFVVDMRREFSAHVVEPFLKAHIEGRTPSPCIDCNRHLKFGALLARAEAVGADRVATGHYVRLDGPPPTLRTALDASRDQAYFLFSVEPSALPRLLFPLGELRKSDVRALASDAGLPVAKKADSQEICFVPDDDHVAFLESRLPPRDRSGPILDEAGRELGRHEGIHAFTVGQRRGLGIALGYPLYVVETRPESRAVVVGPPSSLECREFFIVDQNWFDRPSRDLRVGVRVRHRGTLASARVDGAETARILLDTPLRAVTPGQAAVFYDLESSPDTGSRVLGGGWITRAPPPETP
jgi:tRNA-specific 2-thiouridylase